MHQDKINYLLQRYMSGQLTERESRELLQATGKEHESELLSIIQEMMEAEAIKAPEVDAATLKTAFDRVISVDKTGKTGGAGKTGKAGRTRDTGGTGDTGGTKDTGISGDAGGTGDIGGTGDAWGAAGKIGPGADREEAAAGERRAFPEKPSGTISRRLVTAVAAVFILALGTAVYLLSFPKPLKERERTAPVAILKNDVAPGGNKAVLTLSDGSQIVLDSATEGVLSRQGNSKVLKLSNGQLAYTSNGRSLNDASQPVYNTISTPRGGQYQLVLADGTKVWLNASSSLRYPVAFSGKERSVRLTGEGYFEVAKNEAMPFKVNVNTMEVDVLGTHFNVNAYSDEPTVKTTLLEGAVKIVNEHSASILSPGEQAQVNKEGQFHITSQVDLDGIVAWKDGYFQFNQADLKSIMRQISRWYDVDIRYEGEIPERKFGGEISRTSNMSEVLKILDMSQVHFRIEGKTLILTP
ncbi:MAG TPA: FecR domain-containing protein [Puia sp.]|jgi:ferric-dicitrate binding protein FerR (iron transport regulator)|nr:FecR domain-containing protein [Puia sp.]